MKLAVAVAFLLLGLSGPAPAQTTKQVKVLFEFRQSSTQSGDAVQGGGVTITERGTARPSGRVGAESTERQVTRTSGIFTIVQDGGESTIVVASQVPYPQITYYRDYLTGAGYVTRGMAFREVGTSIRVRATVLPGNQVRVRIAPTISWFSGDRSGVTEVTEASTELLAPNKRPVVVGGASTQLHELTRRVLGVATSQSGSETLMTLTVTILE